MELYSDGSILECRCRLMLTFTGFEMSMSVEDGKAEIILIESGEETK